MPLQSIEPRRLYRQIAGQLRGLIRQGAFPVGSRLPPERDLAAQLNVSRPSVREALIKLEVEGPIEVRMSSGIDVLAREAPASRRVDAPCGPLEVIRARQVIEGELAAAKDAAGACAAIRGHLARSHDRLAAVGNLPGESDAPAQPAATRPRTTR